MNLSKSGVGYSWGVKGYRKTKMANGRTRTTYSIPGTGLSHVEETGSQQKNGEKMVQRECSEVKKPIPRRWWYLLITVLLLWIGIYGFSTGEDPGLAAVLTVVSVIMVIVSIRSARK